MSKRVKGCIAVPVLVTGLLSACTNSQQIVNQNERLERFTRPSVVMIWAGCDGSYAYADSSKKISNSDLSVLSYGSGYFINHDGYIVTNAHVTEYAEKPEKCKDELFNQFVREDLAGALRRQPEVILKDETLRNQLKQKSSLSNFKTFSRVILPNRSKQEPLSFEKTKSGDPNSKDVSIIHLEGKEGENTPSLKLEESDTVQSTARVLVFGYPSDSFLPGVLKQESAFKPSVVDGSVSNTGMELKSGASVLQVSASVSPGNSGGPVISSDGKVIGMVAFQANKGNSSIFYAIPVKTIRDFSKEANVLPNQGPTDFLYQKGLEYYWQKNYTDAIRQFEQVQALFSNHSEVEDLIRQSKAEEAKRRPNYFLLLAIAAIIAAIPALGFILYRRGLVPAGDGMMGSVLDRMTGIWQPTPKLPPKGQTILDNPSKTRVMGVGQPFLELETRLSPVPLQFYLSQDMHQLGRDSEWSDFEIPEQGWEVISRRHAILRREGASYRIFDGDGKPSANGIWVDGKRIDPVKGFLLTNGTQLQFGQTAQTQVILTYFNPTGKAVPQATYVE